MTPFYPPAYYAILERWERHFRTLLHQPYPVARRHVSALRYWAEDGNELLAWETGAPRRGTP